MLEIQQLSHHYPHALFPALTNINLTINTGTCLGLLGPNGAGKTTLISLLCGLQSVQSGQILLNDVPLVHLSKKNSRKISLIPQDFAFYPNLTVWENMRFFAALYQVSSNIFLESILAKIDLLRYKKILAKNLSGGLKRRLNFAIGLINSPNLIFMDEITVGVDPSSRQCILNNIIELSESGITIIYTSHYLHEIEKICQKIVILDHGKIKHEGNIADILHEQVKPKLFIKTQPAVSDIHLAQLNANYQGNPTNLIISDIQQPISNILNFLETHHYEVISLNYGHGSLEAFYLDLLREQAEIPIEAAIEPSGDAL